MIGRYDVRYINTLHDHDVYSFLNCVTDECLKKIAADSDVMPLRMNAALQVLRTRKEVELTVFEWECRTKSEAQFRARCAQLMAELDAFEFGRL